MAVITISRQFGSGGNELAKRVCEALGYTRFDRQLIEQVAVESGLPPERAIDYSEDQHEVKNFLDRLFGRQRRPFEIEAYELDKAASLVQLAILSAYEVGNIIIVGRGGQVILKDKPDVLHVRVEAPMDYRSQKLMRRENVTLGYAQEKIMKMDQAAADYVRRFHLADWSDPMLYHLVLNMGKLSQSVAVDLVVTAVRHMEVVQSSH